MEDERTDEDRIIENLILEGKQALYEDVDFLPSRQSLYNDEGIIPDYDDEIFQKIEWVRPKKVYDDPVYFDPSNRQLAVNQGSLHDEVFLGTLMAICAYSKYDLIENIFASRPEDFLKYGIYTCRFYVDGDWVEVITDTTIPCLRNLHNGSFYPVYGASANTNELWVTFVEKAFAKAMGSYEGIPNIKVQKALLHLTGGSVQQVNLRDDCSRYDLVSDTHAWSEFKRKLNMDSIVICIPSERNYDTNTSNEPEEMRTLTHSDSSFSSNKLYSVILCRDINGHELVLMHNPWRDSSAWTGEWSDMASDWDLYPEVQVEIERDSSIPWRRSHPNGYFWMSFRNMVKHFNTTFYCKLFPNEKFNFYCVRGECRGQHAGGPLTTIRDKEIVLKEAHTSKVHAVQKATAAVVVDGDASWFNNPQYRLQCVNGPATVYVSVVPIDSAEEGETHQPEHHGNMMFVTVTSQPKQIGQPLFLWDVTTFDVLASDKVDYTPVRVKGQETSLWELKLDPKHYYHIVPNTLRRGTECDFILRVFSSCPILMESVPSVFTHSVSGEWRKVGDLDTTGGALKQLHSDGTLRENPKWCQNPQFHVSLVDQWSKDEIYLKIVLRRTDNRRGGGGGSTKGPGDQKKQDATVGLVICKADQLEDTAAAKVKKRPPRQNIMGELIPSKISTLKKRDADKFHDEPPADPNAHVSYADAPKTILRKLSVDPHAYHLVTPMGNKAESCVFYPKIPRSWIPHGLLIVPCLNEKGVKGIFDLDIFSSEEILVNQLPETFSRTIAGEWTDTCAGGSHICTQTWKKNPKFNLKFHYPVNSDEPARVRISLARYGTNWKAMQRKDTVGCMIGFYIFVTRGTDMQQFYESTFSTDVELATDATFTLPQLGHGEVYTIMPTTFNENKLGAFVLSILSEYEFTVTKDK